MGYQFGLFRYRKRLSWLANNSDNEFFLPFFAELNFFNAKGNNFFSIAAINF